MRSITVPNALFAAAERAAKNSGQTIDAYVQDLLELHLEQEIPVELTPAQIDLIALAEEEIDAGNGIPAHQMREFFDQKKSPWTPPLS